MLLRPAEQMCTSEPDFANKLAIEYDHILLQETEFVLTSTDGVGERRGDQVPTTRSPPWVEVNNSLDHLSPT